jgi:plasmid maintenance system antidote protein VapI
MSDELADALAVSESPVSRLVHEKIDLSPVLAPALIGANTADGLAFVGHPTY